MTKLHATALRQQWQPPEQVSHPAKLLRPEQQRVEMQLPQNRSAIHKQTTCCWHPRSSGFVLQPTLRLQVHRQAEA
jgi:hypothetical protein